MTIKTATFGAGCFWCLESAMNQLNGVQRALSGYMGGHTANPTYKQICQSNTGHAEVVQVTFDEDIISFEQLCLVFFTLHDPTQLNRQGNDIGTQYRSVVFYHDETQKQIVQNIIQSIERQHVFLNPVVTEITPVSTFYVAEDEHQGYFLAHPEQAYCQYVIAPKMAKFKEYFSALLKHL